MDTLASLDASSLPLCPATQPRGAVS